MADIEIYEDLFEGRKIYTVFSPEAVEQLRKFLEEIAQGGDSVSFVRNGVTYTIRVRPK